MSVLNTFKMFFFFKGSLCIFSAVNYTTVDNIAIDWQIKLETVEHFNNDSLNLYSHSNQKEQPGY